MDDRLKKALDFSNYRFSLINRKEDIKTKFNTMLLHSCNGGTFKISPEIICFVKLIINNERDTVVLIDVNNNPIEITNVSDFYTDILSKYIEATNYYNFEYNQIKKARKVSLVFDVPDGA